MSSLPISPDSGPQVLVELNQVIHSTGGVMSLPNIKRVSDEFSIESRADKGTSVRIVIKY